MVEKWISDNITVEKDLVWNAKIQFEPIKAERASKETEKPKGTNTEEKLGEEPTDVNDEFEQFIDIGDEKEFEFYCFYSTQLLKSSEPEDRDFYRCILREFWELTEPARKALVLLA